MNVANIERPSGWGHTVMIAKSEIRNQPVYPAIVGMVGGSGVGLEDLG
jgi:hypothetical protein